MHIVSRTAGKTRKLINITDLKFHTHKLSCMYISISISIVLVYSIFVNYIGVSQTYVH